MFSLFYPQYFAKLRHNSNNAFVRLFNQFNAYSIPLFMPSVIERGFIILWHSIFEQLCAQYLLFPTSLSPYYPIYRPYDSNHQFLWVSLYIYFLLGFRFWRDLSRTRAHWFFLQYNNIDLGNVYLVYTIAAEHLCDSSTFGDCFTSRINYATLTH